MGCPMWAHKPWVGRFLPEAMARGESLLAYSRWCNAVEGNTTFYAVPPPSTIASWARQAPEEFNLVCKLPRTITHEARLRGERAERLLAEFLEAIEPLGARVATIVAQLPASFGPADLGQLARFVGTLPRCVHRFAVEVRHPAFFDGSAAARSLEQLLGRNGIEWVPFDTTGLFADPPVTAGERDAWSNKPRVPRRTRALTDRPVIRFIGRDDPERTEAAWQPWLEVVAGWVSEGRTPTFFVHTPANADTPELARRFHEQVRAIVPELEPLAPAQLPVDQPATLF